MILGRALQPHDCFAELEGGGDGRAVGVWPRRPITSATTSRIRVSFIVLMQLMTNDECRNPKKARITKPEGPHPHGERQSLPHLEFFRHSSFGFHHSIVSRYRFPCPAHPRYPRSR